VTRRGRGLLPLFPPICAILLSGCAAGPRPVAVPPVPDRLEGFTAEYQVTWKGSARARKARLAAAYRPPDRLRLEILDPLGSSRAVLVAARRGGILLDPPNREFRGYPEGRDALKALTGIALDADLLAALLLGDPSRAPKIECRSEEGGIAPERICLGPGGDPTLRIRREGREWEVRSPGAEVLRVEMESAPGRAAGPPRRILLRKGPAGISADLHLREFRFLSPPEGLFSLQPPESFREMPGDPPGPMLW